MHELITLVSLVRVCCLVHGIHAKCITQHKTALTKMATLARAAFVGLGFEA